MSFEIYEPNPEHGRPEVARLRYPEGSLGVHVQRETGALWLFAHGPVGGDRGHLVVPPRRAADVLEWVDGEWRTLRGARATTLAGSGTVAVSIADTGSLCLRTRGRLRELRLPLSDDDREALLGCLREWATAAGVATS